MSQVILGPETPGIYDDLVNGTCELSQSFGTVINGEIDLPEDMEEIAGCDGRTSAVLLRRNKINYTFTALFPDTVELPSRGDDVTLPVVGGETGEPGVDTALVGQVVSAKANWTQNGQRQMTITASHWTALGSSPTVTALS